AWLEWTDDAGRSHRAVMNAESGEPASSRRFALTLPGLAGSLRYRAATAAARSRRHTITTVEAPAVVSLAATVEPPAYTRLSPIAARDPARIEAWQGSGVALKLSASK